MVLQQGHLPVQGHQGSTVDGDGEGDAQGLAVAGASPGGGRNRFSTFQHITLRVVIAACLQGMGDSWQTAPASGMAGSVLPWM
jgi:hypothetical protein